MIGTVTAQELTAEVGTQKIGTVRVAALMGWQLIHHLDVVNSAESGWESSFVFRKRPSQQDCLLQVLPLPIQPSPCQNQNPNSMTRNDRW